MSSRIHAIARHTLIVAALAAWPLAAAGGDADGSQAANTAAKSEGRARLIET